MLVIIEGLLKRRVLHAACYIFDDGWRPPVAPPRAQGPGSRVHSQCSVVHVRPRALSFISPSHKQESCVARFHTCAKIKDKHTLLVFYEHSLVSLNLYWQTFYIREDGGSGRQTLGLALSHAALHCCLLSPDPLHRCANCAVCADVALKLRHV